MRKRGTVRDLIRQSHPNAGHGLGALLFVVLTLLVSSCGGDASDVVREPDGIASVSSPIAFAPGEEEVWVVNPDANSVTRLDVRTLTPDPPLSVGEEPWALSVTPEGTVVVMNRKSGSLTVIEDGQPARFVRVGAEPGGMALSPSGRQAYVSLSAAGSVVVVDLARLQIVSHIDVGDRPWSIAVTDDGDQDDDDEIVIVTHRLARNLSGDAGLQDANEGLISLISPSGVIQTIGFDPYEFGFPNALEGLAVVGDEIFVSHLLNKPGDPRDFENTVSGAVSAFSLSGRTELTESHVHVNDPDFSTPVNFPRAIGVTHDGRSAFVALAGSDAVMGIDLAAPEGPRLHGFWAAGSNPRGLILSSDGSRAYVMNYLSRDVSVLDVSDIRNRPELARIAVAPETLDPNIHRGKVLFNNANDPRLSHLGWMSCGSCHVDGGVDGTTWLTPDGPRQTMPLWGLAGTAPFHISATRDEVQDFEVDIEILMDGAGLAPGPANPPLGTPNAGTSADLDALAAFVLNGIRAPASHISDDHSTQRGRELFVSVGCAGCHSGPAWTVSSLSEPAGENAVNGEDQVVAALFDVGTYNPSTDTLGAEGFDVPSLLGIHASAPYLHDGAAETLEAVLGNSLHNPVLLSAQEEEDLIRFLLSIDALTVPVSP